MRANSAKRDTSFKIVDRRHHFFLLPLIYINRLLVTFIIRRLFFSKLTFTFFFPFEIASSMPKRCFAAAARGRMRKSFVFTLFVELFIEKKSFACLFG